MRRVCCHARWLLIQGQGRRKRPLLVLWGCARPALWPLGVLPRQGVGPGPADPCLLPPVGLKKYRRYEVILTAYNIIGESPASAPVEVFVGEAGKLRAPLPSRRPGLALSGPSSAPALRSMGPLHHRELPGLHWERQVCRGLG